MNESSATRVIHDVLPETKMRVWKIADQYTAGIPDAYYGGDNGKSLWTEYKITKRKTTPTRLDVSPLKKNSGRLSHKQQKWLNSHHERNHNVAVTVIHYRPRNAMYYVFRKGQWNTPQSVDNLLVFFNVRDYAHWIMAQTDTNNNE